MANTNSQHVIVGMSGGVDSSVAALLLKEQGYKVTGVFMKNWEEKDDEGICTDTQDFQDVKDVCAAIGIPYYTVNFAKEYMERVFSYFLSEYKKGRTPNPDVLCNSEIKFKAFLEFSLKSGADLMATGHFARLRRPKTGALQLLKGVDRSKDQSYFLSMLRGAQLERALFPVGHLTKEEIRLTAEKHGLPTAQKKDSTGICFIGERNFKQFLMQYLPAQPGDMRTLDGETVGRHDGLMYYTLGQRRGLGLGGAGESWFVIKKDMAQNILYVERGEHELLFSSSLTAESPVWVAGKPPGESFGALAKIRYRQSDQPCHVQVDGGILRVRFDKPQRAITAGQVIAFYDASDSEVCLGGAIISE
ncbi:MAG: tRNA 2-thiouridine(34) synthase MnmA [Christensenellales bacterium]|jgi:tRNA-specific 2-thiouridylase